MKRTFLGVFIVAIVSSCVIVSTPWARDAVGTQVAAQSAPTRIISLIPAVSEMLFAIGAGRQVVAVSSFDDYPPEVLKLPRVGALLDPDLERILSLRPDLVIVYESQVDLRRQLERATIPVFVYKHATLADVGATIRQLGTRIGRDEDAGALVRHIDEKLADIQRRVAGRPRPRTLLVFGRDALTLRGIYASGGFGFLEDMLRTGRRRQHLCRREAAVGAGDDRAHSGAPARGHPGAAIGRDAGGAATQGDRRVADPVVGAGGSDRPDRHHHRRAHGGPWSPRGGGNRAHRAGIAP